MLELLFFIFIAISSVYCVGMTFQNEKLQCHWNSTINEPWMKAIEASDWQSCDKYEAAAERHCSQMLFYVFNPLKWFKVPE